MSFIRRIIRGMGGAVIRNNHMNPLIALGARLSSWYLSYYWNEKYYEMDKNGEQLLLRTLARHWQNAPSITVFDVGANTGSYTKMVRQMLPNSVVHSFEIVPPTREILKAKLSGLENVIINECGLSNAETYLEIGYSADHNTRSRVLSPRFNRVFDEVITCKVQTGDAYIIQQNITAVDLVKIDTEGHEIAVLQGFEGALAKAQIKVIQFEYGTTWIAPKQFLHDVYALLEPLRYQIGRLYPDGVFFKPYNRLEDDHFRMGNYVAVHDKYVPIIKSLNLNPSGRIQKFRR